MGASKRNPAPSPDSWGGLGRGSSVQQLTHNPKPVMQPLRRRINPETFVITLRQIAKHLKTNPKGILNWEKWEHVLWVHLEGRGGYFISYRQLQQWIAACRTLIRGCCNLSTLDALWSAILQEAERYTKEAFAQLEAIWQQRLSYLSTHQRN